jgi:uncharacterized lipoprotein YajG
MPSCWHAYTSSAASNDEKNKADTPKHKHNNFIIKTPNDRDNSLCFYNRAVSNMAAKGYLISIIDQCNIMRFDGCEKSNVVDKHKDF